MKALDLSDENANLEYDVYARLAREHRMAAAVLQAMAEHMASYRDLPMGKHDPKVMTSEELRLAFEKLVEREKDLLNYMRERLAEAEEMLARRDL